MKCQGPDCDKEAGNRKAGFCHGHYKQRIRGVPLTPLRHWTPPPDHKPRRKQAPSVTRYDAAAHAEAAAKPPRCPNCHLILPCNGCPSIYTYAASRSGDSTGLLR